MAKKIVTLLATVRLGTPIMAPNLTPLTPMVPKQIISKEIPMDIEVSDRTIWKGEKTIIPLMKEIVQDGIFDPETKIYYPTHSILCIQIANIVNK